MSNFNEREKAQENKFVLDEEQKFKIASRRRKLLGLWAAELMGLGDEESLKFAIEVVGFGLDDNTPGAVIKKIIKDVGAAGVTLSEADVRAKNAEFEIIATKQISGEKK